MSKPKKQTAKDAWMPLYIGAYLRKTARLTTEQHGAYLLLIMDYWVNGPLPDDDAALAQVAKIDPRKWKAMAPTIRAFFTVREGKLIQDRVERELEVAGRIVALKSEAGKAGAKKRWGKDGKADSKDDGKQDGRTDGTPIADAMANGWQKGSQNDAPSPTPSQIENPNHTPSLGLPRPALPADAALWVRIIRAFDEIRDATFPGQERAFPPQTDRIYAEKFVEIGADIELCRGAFVAACQRFKAENREPPSGLVYFKQIIPDAVKAKNAPLPAGQGRSRPGEPAPLRTKSKDEVDEIERINAGFIKGGDYQSDVSLTQVRAMISKGLLTAEDARKAGYAA